MSPPKVPPHPLPAAGQVPHPPWQRLGPAGPLVAQNLPDDPALSRLSSAPTHPLRDPSGLRGPLRLRLCRAGRGRARPRCGQPGVQPRTGHRADPVRRDLPPKERKHSSGYSPHPRKRPGKRPEAAALGAGPGLLLMLQQPGGLGGSRLWAPGGDGSGPGRGCSPREGHEQRWDEKLRVYVAQRDVEMKERRAVSADSRTLYRVTVSWARTGD